MKWVFCWDLELNYMQNIKNGGTFKHPIWSFLLVSEEIFELNGKYYDLKRKLKQGNIHILRNHKGKGSENPKT